MEMKVLHERFKDDDSPSVEGQIRWLQKQGFAQHQLEQALITVYGEIDRGEVPKVYTFGDQKIYRSHKEPPPDSRWKGENIATGYDLDQYLLQVAKQVRTNELTNQIKQMEKFIEDLHKKWENERRPSFFKRLFRRS